MKTLIGIFLMFATALVVSCEKPEGEGGRATIKGEVIVQLREPVTNTVIAEYPQRDERVYIIYGNESVPIADDDERTTYNGWYQFKNLNPGEYTIYTYSECLACPQEIEPVIRKVSVRKSDEDVLVERIYVTVY